MVHHWRLLDYARLVKGLLLVGTGRCRNVKTVIMIATIISQVLGTACVEPVDVAELEDRCLEFSLRARFFFYILLLLLLLMRLLV